MSKSRPYILKLLISISHCVKSKIMPLIYSDEEAIKKSYIRYFGEELNLDNPRTFAEKMNWYKLYDKNSLMPICADKYDVRKYVEEAGYRETLNDVYAVYDKVGKINVGKLPEKFVLKASHGSHMNLIVKKKSDINWIREKLLMRTWMHQNIYWPLREWPYKDLKRRIIAEQYLEDNQGELRDYKFFCFHGKPKYFQVDFGRFSGTPHRNYYDINQNKLELCDGVPNLKHDGKIIDDKVFEKMIKMVSDLSKPFQQVRVDLYIVNGKIYFGEMTFFDGGGMTGFLDKTWDIKFSEDWIINNDKSSLLN